MTTEYVALPAPPTPEIVAALCALGGEVSVTAQRGEDARGVPRVVLTLTHPDPQRVASARQAVLRECQRLRLRAIVV